MVILYAHITVLNLTGSLGSLLRTSYIWLAVLFYIHIFVCFAFGRSPCVQFTVLAILCCLCLVLAILCCLCLVYASSRKVFNKMVFWFWGLFVTDQRTAGFRFGNVCECAATMENVLENNLMLCRDRFTCIVVLNTRAVLFLGRFPPFHRPRRPLGRVEV
jgi:hypothetical protein